MTKKLKLKQNKPKITENDVKRVVKDYLSVKGWYHFYILQGMGAFKGIPDIIAIKNGRVLFLEIKKPTGKQSEHQKEFQKNIEHQGGEYVLVRKLEDLEKHGV
ncbi:MAG: VRR-NUC domain-containing protein [Bacteriovoracia bacterium]